MDYNFTTVSLDFPVDVFMLPVPLEILEDSLPEETEQFPLVLIRGDDNPEDLFNFSPNGRTLISINDDDGWHLCVCVIVHCDVHCYRQRRSVAAGHSSCPYCGDSSVHVHTCLFCVGSEDWAIANQLMLPSPLAAEERHVLQHSWQDLAEL